MNAKVGTVELCSNTVKRFNSHLKEWEHDARFSPMAWNLNIPGLHYHMPSSLLSCHIALTSIWVSQLAFIAVCTSLISAAGIFCRLEPLGWTKWHLATWCPLPKGRVRTEIPDSYPPGLPDAWQLEINSVCTRAWKYYALNTSCKIKQGKNMRSRDGCALSEK